MAVNPEYSSILNQSHRLQRWYDFHTRELANVIGNQVEHREMENIVHAYLKSAYGLRRDIALPRVIWITHSSAVINITGQPFPIPTLVFSPEQDGVFTALSSEGGEGATVTLPIEFISRGRLNSADSIDSQIVLLPDPSKPGVIPHAERSQHEFTHAVDPLVDIRAKDVIVLREIVAIVGSYSDSETRFTGLTLHPPYIISYLAQQLRSERRGVTRSEFAKMVETVNDLIYNMTHTYPKIPNEQVTRRVMACQSLDELRVNWPQVFPPRSGTDGFDITIRSI